MKIRKATILDAPYIAKVHVDSWRTTYKGILPDKFLQRLTYEGRTKLWESNTKEQNVYVAENKEGVIVGFSVGGKERTGIYQDYEGELNAIYIFQEYQGLGIGKMLMRPVIEELEQASIHSMIVKVLDDNPSKNFYESLGAKKIDQQKVKIADVIITELVYGWKNFRQLKELLSGEMIEKPS